MNVPVNGDPSNALTVLEKISVKKAKTTNKLRTVPPMDNAQVNNEPTNAIL